MRGGTGAQGVVKLNTVVIYTHQYILPTCATYRLTRVEEVSNQICLTDTKKHTSDSDVCFFVSVRQIRRSTICCRMRKRRKARSTWSESSFSTCCGSNRSMCFNDYFSSVLVLTEKRMFVELYHQTKDRTCLLWQRRTVVSRL